MTTTGLGLGLDLRAPRRVANKHETALCPKLRYCDGIGCKVWTGKTEKRRKAAKAKRTVQPKEQEQLDVSA